MLESLLYPESIALIGASRQTGKVGHEILVNLLEGGFAGQIVPVNPSADEVLGLKCLHDLTAHDGSVDLTVIAAPTAFVEEAVKSAISARTKAIVVVTAGFGELGAAGTEMQSFIARLCADSGVRLLGPNCLGVINTDHRMNASFSKRMPKRGGISVLSQSGAVCTAMLDWAVARGLGLAKVVSIGNKADLNECDFLSAFVDDEQTKVIVGYLENITCGDEFIKVACRAASAKPLVLLRAGVTSAGMRAASAHTGHIAGHDIAYAAAFKRAGVIRAESFDALFDYAAALSMQPLPKGDRVAIITNAGGPAVMAADAVEQSGMKVAALNRDSATTLKQELPSAAIISNPIDVLGDADPQRYATAVKAAQRDDAVDSIIVILTPHSMTRPAETARAIAACSSREKPMLAVFLGSADAMSERKELVDCSMPDYPSPERAVAALRAMFGYATWLSQPARVVTRFPVNRNRVDRIISRHQKTNQVQMGEVQAKEILRAYDFNVPDGQVANSADEAAEIAQRITFPVVMKVVSPDILHKSDVGGIKLNISSAEEVRDTFDLLTLRVGRRAPDARLQGIYVEKMCVHGLQVVLGMTYDPQFGPMLMFGLGGTFVDILKDVSCYLAPITADEAMQMLSETRSYALLRGSRGQADIDISAITGALQRISQLATDFPQIAELNIDPYIVGSPGTEPMAVDARITLTADPYPPSQADSGK
ncbi:MAG: acetate--CoA ligase family protein [Phycisphaerales bacterium]|nr:MAG: acetate--CoA ligase family protein [Phycisphaerales bacterium]